MRKRSRVTGALMSVLIGLSGHGLLASSGHAGGMESVKGERAGLVAENPGAIAQNPYVRIPVIDAYHEGRKVWFIHTEVSDVNMAKRLTEMVGYATVHSPKLGKVSPQAAGKIYVFKNGVRRKDAAPWGGGPFHYQIDVLDSVPGDNGYTPLRNPHMVSWKEGASPRVLRSEEEILAAERAGELTIQQTEVIVNAPIVHPHPQGPARDTRRR